MSIIITKRLFTYSLRNLSKTKVDTDGLPISPTWSVNSLFDKTSNHTESITDKQLDHLCQLAQLRPPPRDSISRDDLKSDLNELTKFVEAIQLEDFGTTKPLTHIWQEDTGLALRSDKTVVNSKEEEKQKGRELLKNAKQVSNYFYTVKGQHAEE
ncbi:hypothetical protein BJ944DRAFT_183330 [Cunninghamella echinulata]|nr:hypothetical protein BJ944DRAFT_183330 [Cunninghamella echinulata]